MLTTSEDFADYLCRLRDRAGAPSVRQLASRTGYGKSTISEAFAGRRLPTWELAEALADALGVDEDELRDRWSEAKSGQKQATPAPEWLTSVRSEIPALTGARSIEQVCAVAAQDPKGALDACWGALKVGALQVAHSLYGDIPGSWSSNVVDTYGRAESDGRLPTGARALANTVHAYYVDSQFSTTPAPSTAEVLQAVVLAYRLAWQARDLVDAVSRDVQRRN